jgi:hypothetical protein
LSRSGRSGFVSEPFARSVFVENQYGKRQEQTDTAEKMEIESNMPMLATDTAEARGNAPAIADKINSRIELELFCL